jgi:adenylate cyclase
MARLVAEPVDTADVRARKAVFALAALLFVPPSLLWSLMYLAAGERLAAAIPFSYVLVTGATTALFATRRRFEWARSIQLTLILLLPFSLQIVLGGFVPSSGVVLWSLLAPIGAFVFGAPRAGRWLAAFVVLLVASGLLDHAFRTSNSLPPWLITTFFVLNITVVSTLAVTLLGVFLRQKDEALTLLAAERDRSERLLLNILPPEIAERLKSGEQLIADSHSRATIVFADIVGSTRLALELAPRELVGVLNEIFSAFDELGDRFGVEKIRTIGDNWMGVAGVPRPRTDHAEGAARLALAMRDFITEYRAPGGRQLQVRIGLNSGPLVAGVIGKRKFEFDVWSDAVNTASRMESHGVPGRIHLSEATYALICDRFDCEERGVIDVRGKGPMRTYFLVGVRSL